MNFTVVWLLDAENELAAIWLTSNRRTDVTRASAELDRRRTADAANEGESRPNGRRITLEPPLAVIFRVDANATSVVVSQVWEF